MTISATITSFGTSARIDFFSADGAVVSSVRVVGRQVVRGQDITVTADDTASQGQYGVRSGSDIASTYVGTTAEAQGIVDHIVWRFAQPLKRPSVDLHNLFPDMLAHDLYEQAGLTVAALYVTDRRFEIVGVSGSCVLAANASTQDWTVTWQLQESRLQADQQFFTLDVSALNGPDLLGY